ncbi:uncharacterized protein LOC106132775 isoform X1 [Amyelois transitella]|uniref:uncharacterized protein LOC106132775 isoform X1 n=1 Tax=Amyelois transitella TaxID=680683 RepID=UPI00298FF1D4|nr:uncharacterized protein LOC106132775 isoform X1 [Amyelois transitella]XP_013187756.2 uncharacterized protein LOC106132775 isoform X1 [Amyelois transitella]XP_013187757.2 uncharacterized protein LOC106132775 isoform X1 [Amyelois transitella]
MELVQFAKELFQNAAEQVASYRIGQTILRQLDRALWVVEKCARWAVPPPLDQDEHPQPELIRPLPWVFFLTLLVVLRVTRESISLINLVRGKPPLRSADVVMYIQGKRRYLRTLKYQGNRIMRARTSSAQPPQGWMSRIQSLFEVTMCFRGRQSQYGNNNTSTNNEELLVVKRSKRTREPSTSGTGETSMERVIEKMMVDLGADSDEDSSYTLTNANTVRSDRSESPDSYRDAAFLNDTGDTQDEASPIKTDPSPVKSDNGTPINNSPQKESPKGIATTEKPCDADDITLEKQSHQDAKGHEFGSPKIESQMLLESEKRSPNKTRASPKSEQKIANGRAVSAHNKKRGSHVERRDANAPVTTKADMS